MEKTNLFKKQIKNSPKNEEKKTTTPVSGDKKISKQKTNSKKTQQKAVSTKKTQTMLKSKSKTIEKKIDKEIKNTPKPSVKKNSKGMSLKQSSDVKVYSLGGLGVVGMNMYVVEQNDEILVMDAGILFADDDVHGVNYIIPDFTYLQANQNRIIGLFITHGHEDHIGAIPFLLQKVKIPTIYASGLAVGLIKNKMAEFPDVNYNITEYTRDSLFKFKNFEVSFFRTNHSIPDSFGIAIKTNLGYVVNTGDFKFDFSPLGPASDYYKMTSLGEKGVCCLLAESTNANISQFSSSERKIGETLSSLFHQISGRIIVATFASNVYRVQQIIEASIATGRKVVVFGHSMELTIEVATRLKYINAPKGWIQKARDMKKIDSNHITILCTGSQGEPLAALSRIASGTHKQIKLQPNDTVIYSSKPIPGNEQFINRNVNKLVHAGAHVIRNNPLTDTHTTGHASQNELRMMLAFMKPKYFIPVHGEYAMLKKHVEIAEMQGIPKQNCFVLGTGDVLSINNKSAKVLKGAIPASDIYLDSALSDVDSGVLKERKKMADEGLISITYFINKKKQLISTPIIASRGFMTPESATLLLNSFTNKSIDIFKTLTSNKEHYVISSTEKQIINQMVQYIYHKMDRKPLIVVSIKQVAI